MELDTELKLQQNKQYFQEMLVSACVCCVLIGHKAIVAIPSILLRRVAGHRGRVAGHRRRRWVSGGEGAVPECPCFRSVASSNSSPVLAMTMRRSRNTFFGSL